MAVGPASGRRRWPWCRRRRSTRWRASRGPGRNRCCWRRGRRCRARMTGQASLIQQISSIWWMFISANSPPETQKKRTKLRICQSSSFSPAGLRAHAADRLHAVGADEHDVAELAVADPLDQLLAVDAVAALQAGGDLEVLLLGLFAGPDQPPQAGRVGRERLLHEDVHALLDGVFELRGAEGGNSWSASPRRPGPGSRWPSVGVEADELPVLAARRPGRRTSCSGPCRRCRAGSRRRRPWRPA